MVIYRFILNNLYTNPPTVYKKNYLEQALANFLKIIFGVNNLKRLGKQKVLFCGPWTLPACVPSLNCFVHGRVMYHAFFATK